MKIIYVFTFALVLTTYQSYSQKVVKWSIRNLNVSTFSNGDSIPEARSNEEWIKAGAEGKPAWCYYKNDPANADKYGKLYNWYAVNDIRGLAPKGCHIATNDEWAGVIGHFGGDKEAGKNMKSSTGWENGGNGHDTTGFSVLPAGYRFYLDGEFLYEGKYGLFWTSTPKDSKNAWIFFLSAADFKASSVDYDKGCGMSCRYAQD